MPANGLDCTGIKPQIRPSVTQAVFRQKMLGTDAAWQRLAKLHSTYERPQFLLTFMGPQYPWYWSASVLAGLFGLSACVLHFQVKSLDRLK